MHPLIITLLGAPGSGKGTLARLCAQRLGFKILSTGDILRQQIADKTAIGLQVSEIINRGALVSDDLITRVVFEKLGESGKSHIILDGYPRTRVQAEQLSSYLKKAGRSKQFHVILLEISDDLIIQRLANRLVCSNENCQAVYSLLVRPPVEPGICDECGEKLIRRPDDELRAIRARLKIYSHNRDELMSFYRHSGCAIEVLDLDEKTIPQVFWEFRTLLKIDSV